MMMKVIGNYVLVEPIKAKVKQGAGGIIKASNEENLLKGKVILVGDGICEGDYKYPPDFKTGDIVYYNNDDYDRFFIVYKKKSCNIICVHDILLKGENE